MCMSTGTFCGVKAWAAQLFSGSLTPPVAASAGGVVPGGGSEKPPLPLEPPEPPGAWEPPAPPEPVGSGLVGPRPLSTLAGPQPAARKATNPTQAKRRLPVLLICVLLEPGLV